MSGDKRDLVDDAAIDPQAREALRFELITYVTNATREFMKERGLEENRESELVDVGMSVFDHVFNIYLKNNSGNGKDKGYFFKYYVWWMRQAIVAHLQKVG
jgi:hypothetical protein